MKRSLILVFVFALTLGAGSALAETVEGTLVDGKCYTGMGEKDNDHNTPGGEMKDCGTMCAKMGIPTGIVTSKGKFYTLLAPSMAVANFIGQTVKADGMVKNGALIADEIQVKQGSSWKKVKIGGMM